ncbi:integral membrane protein [Seiridium cupressi]
MSHAPSSALLPRQAIDLNGPALAPPTGMVSQLDNPPNENHIAVPVISVCVAITAVFYFIRFYAKYLTKQINLSDYLSAVAFPIFWVYVYYSYRLSWSPGYLIHEWDMRLKDISAFSYVCFMGTTLYLWIIALVKCSILVEWVNIFVPKGKRTYFTWMCYATCVAISLLSIIIFIMNLVNCTPFQANYDPLTPNYFCRFKVPEFGLASSTTNFVLDLIPLILAQRVIWGLRMSLSKKLGVSVVFLVGLTGCASSLVRLYFATQFYVSTDVTYFYSIMALCSLCEVTCAHLIFCAPHVPKVIGGIKQSKTISGIKRYISSRGSSKSDATYINQSDGFGETAELKSAGNPNSQRFVNSRGTDRQTTYSEESERTLRQPSFV